MNLLGLEYGSSSSDEEDDRARTAPPAKVESSVVAAPAPSTVEAPVAQTAAKSDELPAKPAENTVDANVSTAVTTGPDAPMDDGDDEAMLLRAGIPPAATPLADDDETQQRIERFLRVQRERGQDFQTTLQDKKEVRNPYILEKVVEYFGIDELQSNFPRMYLIRMVFRCTNSPMHWLSSRKSGRMLEHSANCSSNGMVRTRASCNSYQVTHRVTEVKGVKCCSKKVTQLRRQST